MEMNLFEKLDDGVTSIKELTIETLKDHPIKDCFPACAYRCVTIDNKNYQLQIEVTLREI